MSEEHAESRMAQLWTFLKSVGDLGLAWKHMERNAQDSETPPFFPRREDLLGWAVILAAAPRVRCVSSRRMHCASTVSVQGSGHCCTALGCSVQKCLSQSIAAVQLELLQGSKHSLRRSASSRSSSSVENPVKTHHNSFPAGACAHVVSSLTFHCCPRVHPEQGLGSKQLTTPCHTDFNFKGYSSTPSIWPRLRSAVAGTGRVTLMLAAALKEVFE